MARLEVKEKALKLINVLCFHMDIASLHVNMNLQIEKVQNYIKTKGAKQIGPMIQYTRTYVNEKNEIDIEIIYMLQCNTMLHDVEHPYTMETEIRVPNCMYIHYVGSGEKLKFAYDKIALEAFELGVKLADENYTVFIDDSNEEEGLVADVFVPMIK